MSNNEKDHEFWILPLGVSLTIMILVTIGLVAANGWKWYSDFLSNSAASWAQAIGTFVAILATAHFAGADRRRREDQELIVAELTASRITGELANLEIATTVFGKRFREMSKVDMGPNEFHRMRDLVRSSKLSITDTDLLRLAPLPKEVAHEIVDLIFILDDTSKALGSLLNNPRTQTSAEFRLKQAQLLYSNALHIHRMALSAHEELTKFLTLRGVKFTLVDFASTSEVASWDRES